MGSPHTEALDLFPVLNVLPAIRLSDHFVCCIAPWLYGLHAFIPNLLWLWRHALALQIRSLEMGGRKVGKLVKIGYMTMHINDICLRQVDAHHWRHWLAGHVWSVQVDITYQPSLNFLMPSKPSFDHAFSACHVPPKFLSMLISWWGMRLDLDIQFQIQIW